MHSTPPSLLQQLRTAPDAVAWGEFVELYTPLLFDWTRRARLTDDDAADLIQDVFVVLVEKLPQFEYDPGKSFRAWLKTVLLNRWRNLAKRQARQVDADGHLDDLAAPDDFADIDERDYQANLAGQALRLMQAEFGESVWRACWMCVVEERSTQDVATDLGISANSVYAAKCRVLTRLRQKLAGLMD